MASRSLMFAENTQTADVLEELVRESLRALLLVTVAVVWLWGVVSPYTEGLHTDLAYLSLAASLGAVLGAWSLQERRLGLGLLCYLGGVCLSVTLMALASSGVGRLYLYVLVVLIAAALTNPLTAWAITGACAALVLALGLRDPGVGPLGVISPLATLLLTAFTVWLGSRRLYTALSWSLTMTEQARRNEIEARERRAEVRSMLKSLEEAYARLERANEALIFAREAAEKAYRFKSEFVANVSHELRTPLNLIVGFSEMVATAPESYKGVPLPSEYRGDVMAIYRSARHLGDLINDVLDLSQIEAGRLPLAREVADLGEIVRDAAEMVRGLTEAKGLRLEIDLSEDVPPLRLDPTRIRQVLLNLLTNAARFTDKGWIRVGAEKHGPEVRVTVADSGQGIAPDRLSRAFEAFSQLGEDEARKGTGLGLALSKRFVELHGGTMWIESVPRSGTTVSFSLPMPQTGRGAPLTLSAGRPAPGSDGRPRVLVVHDDARTLSLLQRYAEGYQLVTAETVARALEIIREAAPAAVIVDAAQAGDWQGLATRGELAGELPVLTCPLPGAQRLGALLGAAEYLAKPLTREQLLGALARLPRPPRSVLIVDDDPNFVRLVTRVLKAHDPSLQLLEASGGAEGLGIARTRRPDAVLLDLLMPGLSGYGFLEAAKGDADLAGIPVIVMSARGVGEEARPLEGEFRLSRGRGFAPGEIVEVMGALLPVMTRQGAMVSASG